MSIINKWIILSKKNKDSNEFNSLYKGDYFYFYYNHKNAVLFDDVVIYIDGWVMPRGHCYSKYSHLNMHEFIHLIYIEYNDSITNFIKGNFNIIIASKNKILVLNDRLSVKKFFYHIDSSTKEFMISNNINAIRDNKNFNLSYTSIALHALMHHYIDGRTMYEELFYSKNATKLTIVNNAISLGEYWKIHQLLEKNIIDLDTKEFALAYDEILNNIIKYLKPINPAMTLTGGLDTRTILAALLKNNIKPISYTFGDSNSEDAVAAKNVASCFDLKYDCHEVNNPNLDDYQKSSNQISEIGNSMINLHRTHRLQAIKKQLNKTSNIDMIFVGSMGGEAIRGLHFDDLIVTKFYRLWMQKKDNIDNLIKETLIENFIDIKKIDLDEIKSILLKQDYFGDSYKKNEFHILFHLTASIHDVQDIEIYSNYVKFPVPIFMDIDYLNLLFSTKYNMMHKNNTSKNPLNRLDIPYLNSHIIYYLNEELSKIPFNYQYSPYEYVKQGKIIYFLKRVYRRLFTKVMPPTYPYDEWYAKYLLNEFSEIPDKFLELFDFKKMKKSLNYGAHKKNEGYWQKYTNILGVYKYLNK